MSILVSDRSVVDNRPLELGSQALGLGRISSLASSCSRASRANMWALLGADLGQACKH